MCCECVPPPPPRLVYDSAAAAVCARRTTCGLAGDGRTRSANAFVRSNRSTFTCRDVARWTTRTADRSSLAALRAHHAFGGCLRVLLSPPRQGVCEHHSSWEYHAAPMYRCLQNICVPVRPQGQSMCHQSGARSTVSGSRPSLGVPPAEIRAAGAPVQYFIIRNPQFPASASKCGRVTRSVTHSLVPSRPLRS
jgi:hypothetical protein